MQLIIAALSSTAAMNGVVHVPAPYHPAPWKGLRGSERNLQNPSGEHTNAKGAISIEEFKEGGTLYDSIRVKYKEDCGWTRWVLTVNRDPILLRSQMATARSLKTMYPQPHHLMISVDKTLPTLCSPFSKVTGLRVLGTLSCLLPFPHCAET
jgi:hypothetical protein